MPDDELPPPIPQMKTMVEQYEYDHERKPFLQEHINRKKQKELEEQEKQTRLKYYEQFKKEQINPTT